VGRLQAEQRRLVQQAEQRRWVGRDKVEKRRRMDGPRGDSLERA